MSDFLSTLTEAKVHDLHRLVKNGDKKYLCFTKVTKSKAWSVLVSDGLDVWLQEYDEDSVDTLMDLSGIKAIDAYLAKFRNGFSSGNLSVTKMETKVKFTIGSGSSALELDLFEAKAADKKNELQSILLRLTEHCTQLEADLASANQQLDKLRAQKATAGGASALMDFGQKKGGGHGKAKLTKAGMSVINPTSRKRKAATGVVFGDDDDDE